MAVSREFHIAYGRHSGIPDCCIKFFVEEWNAKELWRDKTLYIVRAINASPAHYVQCPECLGQSQIVGIRDCRIECGKECGDEFKRRYNASTFDSVRDSSLYVIPSSTSADKTRMYRQTPL